MNSKTQALLNSNKLGYNKGGNQYYLEHFLGGCAKGKGAYVISLLACDRRPLPEEAKSEGRGGTEANAPRSIEQPGQNITIHASPDRFWICPETPSLA